MGHVSQNVVVGSQHHQLSAVVAVGHVSHNEVVDSQHHQLSAVGNGSRVSDVSHNVVVGIVVID